MTLKVIGAGFGRTGTNSLKVALEELGFEKCYHMIEVFKNPSHMQKWSNIFEGGQPDWESLFEGYQAAVDWPASAYYKELLSAYPDAKMILSVRNPERWHESTVSTIYQVNQRFGRVLQFIPGAGRFFSGINKIIWNGIFHGQLEDKAYSINVFNQHIEEVKRTVPSENLLIFEARQGWAPLCAFLNVPVPEGKPYPHINDSARIKRMLKYGPAVLSGILVTLGAFIVMLIRSLLSG